MLFIKIGRRIINTQNIKFIELVENSQGKEIRFYFIDGSYSYYSLKNEEEDREFEYVWQSLNSLDGIKLAKEVEP
jgi:hypothetical protein